ncbi:hypothetical protein NHQ30_004617 [Ciborinia camelliae]|nr:hypothetical protein NHQ30_004617 [Ciborinia camelliae]
MSKNRTTKSKKPALRNLQLKQRLRTQKIAAIPAHQFIEYVTRNQSLRIMLDFATETTISQKETIFNSFFEILPQYAKHVSVVYIGVLFIRRDQDDLIHNGARRDILEMVVEELNNFKLSELRFVLHLHYLTFEQISPVNAIYGLKFQSWKFDILTDDVVHVKHGCMIDRLLSSRYGIERDRHILGG